MAVGIQSQRRSGKMGVIGGGDQNGIDVFLVKNFAKVLIKGRLWELLAGLADAAGIHITKSGHGPAGWFDFNEIGTTPTGYPDDANANLLGGRIPVGGANQWNGGGRTQKERYMRGLRAWVGFRQTSLEYDRPDRKTGKTKYSVARLLRLATQGITSTTVKPLFISGILTIMILVMISAIGLYALLRKSMVPENQMPVGWTSITLTISLVGFGQLMSTWLLSLYIARLYREVISRPTYIVENDSLPISSPTTPIITRSHE